MHCRHMHTCALTQTTPWCFLFRLSLAHDLPVCRKDPSTSVGMTGGRRIASHSLSHRCVDPSCAFGAGRLASQEGALMGRLGASLADLEVLCRTSTVLYTSRGRKPSTRPGGVSRSRTEPLAPRAVRPGGAINPRGEAASTFGNTASRRIPHKGPSSQMIRTAKKHQSSD